VRILLQVTQGRHQSDVRSRLLRRHRVHAMEGSVLPDPVAGLGLHHDYRLPARRRRTGSSDETHRDPLHQPRLRDDDEVHLAARQEAIPYDGPHDGRRQVFMMKLVVLILIT